MTKARGLLVKVQGSGKGFAGVARGFGLGRVRVREILTVPARPRGRGMGAAAQSPATWLAIETEDEHGGNPWDDAHALLVPGGAFAAAGLPPPLAVEPDFEQRWDYQRASATRTAAGAAPSCSFDPQNPAGGRAVVSGRLAWHLDPDFSQFSAARNKVGANQKKVIVAHLDTGYDKRHKSVPLNVLTAKERDFVADPPKNDATDRAPSGSPTANRGHGSGTLSILAGNKVDPSSPGWTGFSDFLGAAPQVSVLPIRIADWVVRFSTGNMVEGFNYARAQGAHVLTMSMGGLSSSALVDAINLAYDSGLVIVTAAGNNFAGVPSPRSIVFPARYKRVIAACGVMGDGRAYAGLDTGTMQGNFGPAEKMETAIGAYTPNTPWAQIDCGNVIDMDGAGTSAATPQVAAAAALWLAEHFDKVQQYSKPWMRIEAVRKALFSSAAKSTPKMGSAETREKIGQGVLRAEAALAIRPEAASALTMTPPAQDSWSWTDILFGGGVSLAPGLGSDRQRMLALELTQMAQRVRSVDEAIPNPEADPKKIPAAAISRYLEAALDEGEPSRALRAALERRLQRKPVARGSSSKPVPERVVRKPHVPPPPHRRLRIYALDPTVGKRLDSVSVQEATISVPWDDEPVADKLLPGPVGEYLEVVDVDPSTRRLYEPVDLNSKELLAQDGLPPSEGNPQFHQQMVYAIAMTTIRHFERALGRRALWAPHFDSKTGKAYEVRRLRIYPHALRARNAYYSPDKVALLFGYFQAESQPGATTPPGTMVFSCLSSDIIAHEMSHALLDGLHRRFQEASNPDVPAFHEAFADIVAMFQHFTLRELVKFEIARTRGDLQAANLLQGLAKQFGEGSGRDGPLRDYGESKMGELDYDTTMEPHDRGSILVFAVYDAFLAIIAQRIAHLTRLATGGSGILPGGALHPGLVDGLTDQVIKTAEHMLTICIRALDYCPATDITYGEYLRAIITSDIDAYPNDPYNYRIAIMEAFRKWKLLPRDVRTVSMETLTWDVPDSPAMQGKLVKDLIGYIDLGWNQRLSRSKIFDLNERNRWKFFGALGAAFKRDPSLLMQFGLMPRLPRYRGDGTLAKRPARGSTTFEVHGVRPTRRVEPDGSFRTEIIAIIQQRVPLRLDGTIAMDGVKKGEDFVWFRGGATVIIDPREGQEAIRFAIIKQTSSERRRKRQLETSGASYFSPLRTLYFGESSREPFAMLHAQEERDEDG